MTPETTVQTHSERYETAAPLIEDSMLAKADDASLKMLITRARDLLTEREYSRKREAIARIKALAKEHGLDVAIETNPAKRGRKPKKA